jgi:hypothetical protein
MPTTTTRQAGAEILFYVEDAPEGGFVARDASASIFTEADTMAELHAALRDAVRCHFDEGNRPGQIRTHYVQQTVFATG